MRILERSLSYIADRGWIHPAEIPFLSRFGYRKRARRYAKEHDGRSQRGSSGATRSSRPRWRSCTTRLMSGRTMPRGIERTYALLDAMYALRPMLRFPPALSALRR